MPQITSCRHVLEVDQPIPPGHAFALIGNIVPLHTERKRKCPGWAKRPLYKILPAAPTYQKQGIPGSPKTASQYAGKPKWSLYTPGTLPPRTLGCKASGRGELPPQNADTETYHRGFRTYNFKPPSPHRAGRPLTAGSRSNHWLQIRYTVEPQNTPARRL